MSKVGTTIRIDKDIYDWLVLEADRQKRSYGNYVNMLLSQIKEQATSNKENPVTIKYVHTDVRQ